jgi:hypothetical protein
MNKNFAKQKNHCIFAKILERHLMRKNILLRAIILLVSLPILLISCEGNTDMDIETAIIGYWKITQATRQNSEGAREDILSTTTQIWGFDRGGKLHIEDVQYDYTLSDRWIYTSYAQYYSNSNDSDQWYFFLGNLTSKKMTLSTSYEEKDKVGRRTITYTFTFERLPIEI